MHSAYRLNGLVDLDRVFVGLLQSQSTKPCGTMKHGEALDRFEHMQVNPLKNARAACSAKYGLPSESLKKQRKAKACLLRQDFNL